LSDRWWQRKRRNDQWFKEFLSETDKTEKDLDAMFHRVFGKAIEKEKCLRHNFTHLTDRPSAHTSGARINDETEPLVDIFVKGSQIMIVAELFGVDKNSIELHVSEGKLIISADSPTQRYNQEINLPARVDVKSSTSTLKNGVLEIRFEKLDEKLVIR
jgi:HSP20 family molecular chaperone IbpA